MCPEQLSELCELYSPLYPKTSKARTFRTPGVSKGTMIMLWRLWRGAEELLVLPMTIPKVH